MPYGKTSNYRYKKRRYPRKKRGGKPWYMRKYNAYELAGKAWSAAKYLKGLINVEFKKYDADSSTSTSGNVILFNGIAQGDSDQTRDGNSVLMKSWLLRGNIVSNASAVSTRVRLVFFMDKQQIGDTAPSQSDILDPDLNQLVAPLNNQTVGRFTILADKRFSINQMVASQSVSREFSFFFNLGKHARFNGTTGADIQKNGIYMLVVHDQSTNVPNILYSSRLKYVDN